MHYHCCGIIEMEKCLQPDVQELGSNNTLTIMGHWYTIPLCSDNEHIPITTVLTHIHIDGLVQDCSNSSALAPDYGFVYIKQILWKHKMVIGPPKLFTGCPTYFYSGMRTGKLCWVWINVGINYHYGYRCSEIAIADHQSTQ